MKFRYFDTHAHINHEPLLSSADEICKISNEKGLIINNIGTNIETSKLAIDQAKKYDNVYATIGIHPCDVNNIDHNKVFEELENLLKEEKVIAIGETGFDYHYPNFDKEKQLTFFNNHVSLAIKYELPLVLHIRDAHTETFNLIKELIDKKMTVIIHCFDSTPEMAKKYSEIGCYIAFGGKITYNNATNLQEAIKNVDLNKLIVETDAPWLSPLKHRKEINKPYFIIDSIIPKISEILNIPIDELSKKIYENSLKCFNLKI